jgi:hypothetical protein
MHVGSPGGDIKQTVGVIRLLFGDRAPDQSAVGLPRLLEDQCNC